MTIGQEIVFRVRSTGKGTRVTRYDGVGLAEGIAGRRHLRYFYGDNADEKATDYAYKKADRQDAETRVVELGERL
jgi:ribosomal protein L20